MVRVLRSFVPVGALAGVLADLILFFGSFLVVIWAQRAANYTLAPSANEVALSALFTLLMVGVNTSLSLYRRGDLPATTVASRAAAGALIGCALTYVALGLPHQATARPESEDLTSRAFMLALYALVVLRQAMFFVRSTSLGVRRTLVVGMGPEAREVLETLRSNPRNEIVGIYEAGEDNAIKGEHVRVFPRSASLWGLVTRWGVDEVVVAVKEQRGGVLPLRELLECRINGVRVVDLSSFNERSKGEFPISSLKASWLIYGEGFEQGAGRTLVKRMFDLLMSGVLLTATAPIMLVTAILIRLESRGPIIYRQERVGHGGRTFHVLKFRSMRADAERNGVAQWAQKSDPRITRIGKFIRKTRIDELPQLWNVLNGEMSLVGPRPERPSFVNQLKEEIRFYDVRHSIKPGLTGWAQVRNGYTSTMEDTKFKLQYDLYYVKNHSLFLDLLILLRTVRVILLAEGAR